MDAHAAGMQHFLRKIGSFAKTGVLFQTRYPERVICAKDLVDEMSSSAIIGSFLNKNNILMLFFLPHHGRLLVSDNFFQ
jgi:hypothetical protein